jgi:hypothetical protein
MVLVVLVAEAWGLLLGGVFMQPRKAQTATTVIMLTFLLVGARGGGGRGGPVATPPCIPLSPRRHGARAALHWFSRAERAARTCRCPPAPQVGGYYARSIPAWIGWVRRGVGGGGRAALETHAEQVRVGVRAAVER